MSFLHNKTSLDKRRDNALKSHSSSFFSKTSSVLLGMLFGAIGCVIIFSLFFSGDSYVTKKQLEMAVEKAKKEGVSIKNVSYKNAKTKTEASAKSAVQTKDKLALKGVAIGVKGRGKIIAENADIIGNSGIVKATGSVVYTQKDGVEIKGDTIVLNNDSNIITGSGGITISGKNVTVKGDSVIYDISKDVLNIKDNVVIEIE